jgi:hypothetical protein
LKLSFGESEFATREAATDKKRVLLLELTYNIPLPQGGSKASKAGYYFQNGLEDSHGVKDFAYFRRLRHLFKTAVFPQLIVHKKAFVISSLLQKDSA